MGKEAYVVVTLQVTVAVEYDGDMPTKDDCIHALERYESDNGVDILEAVDVVGIELDPDTDVVGE